MLNTALHQLVATPPVDTVESAQRHPDGTARFHVLACPDHPDWARAEADERADGVAAALRIFLDAQLEEGDIVVDVAPGFGFITLSAATAPAGVPSVFALQQSESPFEAMQTAARNAGGWVEPFTVEALATGALTDGLVERLPEEGRLFLHANVHTLHAVLKGVAPLVLLGRVVACCLSVSDEDDVTARTDATRMLHALGFGLHEMREHEGEPQLFAIVEIPPRTCVIALAGASALSDGTLPPPALQVSSTTSAPWGANTSASPIMTRPVVPPVFSFIAPHCRTGYGIVGAHLLREFQRQDAPVAYFPLGRVDPTVVHNDLVGKAIARQGSFDDAAPSVRLSQQFDLALHVGRGPRIGFPIFELDRLHANERHHLERQDRLLVTCEWARGVLLENGVWKTPIDIVPLGVDRNVFHERVQPTARASSDTVFMSVGKLEQRKGQLELLHAFEAAFTPKDSVKMVVLCHNAFVDEKAFADMVSPFRSSRMAARITLVTKPLPTQRDLATVMASASCAVFPVRAEGWNLEALEMLSMGKPVIATDCTGHTAYLDHHNARLIAIDALEESMPGETRGRWAAWGDAQHEQLVEQLRAVHTERQSGTLEVNRAGIATAERLSWASSANALMHSVVSA